VELKKQSECTDTMAAKVDNEDVGSIQKLTNKNTYPMWFFEVKILFRAKQLWDIVEGTSKLADCENDESKIDKWKTKDAAAQHVILRTVDKSVKVHLMTCDSAKDMFNTLTRIYKKDSSQEKCLLLQEFYNYTFEKSKDIQTNISQIQNLVFKLKVLEEEISDSMLISKIMTVLPEKYKHFSSAWDSTSKDDKTIENLISRLCQEEDKIKMGSKEETPVTFRANMKENKDYNGITCFGCGQKGHIKSQCKKNTEKYCSRCKKNNHTENQCFNKNKACIYCKKTNHKEENCFFRKQHEETNKTTFNSDKNHNNNGKQNKHSKVSFFALNNESVDDDASNVFEMIVDSGCNKMMDGKGEKHYLLT